MFQLYFLLRVNTKQPKDERNFYDNVYSILVEYAKAPEHMRENFITSPFENQQYPCDEWRFCGVFGFGGKYRRQTNSVDYYSEDQSPKLDKLEKRINTLLKELHNGN